jgi:hypothetical protein
MLWASWRAWGIGEAATGPGPACASQEIPMDSRSPQLVAGLQPRTDKALADLPHQRLSDASADHFVAVLLELHLQRTQQ